MHWSYIGICYLGRFQGRFCQEAGHSKVVEIINFQVSPDTLDKLSTLAHLEEVIVKYCQYMTYKNIAADGTLTLLALQCSRISLYGSCCTHFDILQILRCTRFSFIRS